MNGQSGRHVVVAGLGCTLACGIADLPGPGQGDATPEPSVTSSPTTGSTSPSATNGISTDGATSLPPDPTTRPVGPASTGALPTSGAAEAGFPSVDTDGSATPPRQGTIRIMPLGDSITEICGYRPRLWRHLTEAGLDVDFVGTSTQNGDCGVAGADADHEGHGGYLVTEVATTGTSELMKWAAVAPDLVLMHFGTNDVWNGRPADTPPSTAPGTDILDAYDVVVDAFRRANPRVWFVVAQIIPMAPDASTCDGCTPCQACPLGVRSLNGAIPAWARARSTDSSPILVVDQFAGFDVNADTTDLVHPNAGGAQKMADRWFEVVAPLI